MRVAVIGYGVEGSAAVTYWMGLGASVVVHERRADAAVPASAELRSGDAYLTGLDEVDVIVRSPTVRPEALPSDGRVTSVMSEFFARCPVPIVGVTGTKGKGTTCTVVASILRAAGFRAYVGGNIGTVPLSFLPELGSGDVFVMEMSNFQLMDMTQSPTVAAVLSITPDHLNWHRDLDEYYAAKSSIAAFQAPHGRVVYAARNPVATQIAMRSPGRPVPVGDHAGVEIVDDSVVIGGQRIIRLDESPLIGRHNLENIAAAAGATFELVGGDHDAIRRGVLAARPLPHRLSLVATVDDVTYVDDSLSTTPETTIAAMAAFGQPKVLILGGSTKGVSFDLLAKAVADSNTRIALLVGAEAERIAAALDVAGFSRYEVVRGPMPTLVAHARAAAHRGDAVLLSPACSSIGDFRDYADRGGQFTDAVNALI